MRFSLAEAKSRLSQIAEDLPVIAKMSVVSMAKIDANTLEKFHQAGFMMEINELGNIKRLKFAGGEQLEGLLENKKAISSVTVESKWEISFSIVETAGGSKVRDPVVHKNIEWIRALLSIEHGQYTKKREYWRSRTIDESGSFGHKF